MRVVVLTNESLKEELLAQGVQQNLQLLWTSQASELAGHEEADAFIDLLFDYNKERIELLKKLPPRPVFINAVTGTLKDLPDNFIRINGWPGFLRRTVIEAAAGEAVKQTATEIITALNKKPEWVADIPGFIAARVVSMIVNEAYFTLDEKVSSKEETDTAMKLGTNYPYGPFEWADKIGLKNIADLLGELSKEKNRYQPAALLLKEVN